MDFLADDALQQLERKADAEEFKRLSLEPNGDSGGWKFDREDLYD